MNVYRPTYRSPGTYSGTRIAAVYIIQSGVVLTSAL